MRMFQQPVHYFSAVNAETQLSKRFCLRNARPNSTTLRARPDSQHYPPLPLFLPLFPPLFYIKALSVYMTPGLVGRSADHELIYGASAWKRSFHVADTEIKYRQRALLIG